MAATCIQTDYAKNHKQTNYFSWIYPVLLCAFRPFFHFIYLYCFSFSCLILRARAGELLRLYFAKYYCQYHCKRSPLCQLGWYKGCTSVKWTRSRMAQIKKGRRVEYMTPLTVFEPTLERLFHEMNGCIPLLFIRYWPIF